MVSACKCAKSIALANWPPMSGSLASNPLLPGLSMLFLKSQRRSLLHHWAQLSVPGATPSGALHYGSPAPPQEECRGSPGALKPSSRFWAWVGHRGQQSGRSQAWPSAEMAQTLGWQPTDARVQTWCVYGSSLIEAAPRSGGGARRSSPGSDLCRDAQEVKDLARVGISQGFGETET